MKTAIATMDNKKMDETAIVFSKDCADKKRTARGAMSRRKKMAEPMMTKAQIDAKHGPVSTFELHKPLNWAAFTQLPKDLQPEYLSGLVKKFNISTLDLTQLFGCKKSALSTYLNDKNLMLVVSAARDWNKPTDHEGWQNFCNQLWAPEKVKIVKPAAPVISRFEHKQKEIVPTEKAGSGKEVTQTNDKKVRLLVKCVEAIAHEYKMSRNTIVEMFGIKYNTYWRMKKGFENAGDRVVDDLLKQIENFDPTLAKKNGMDVSTERILEIREEKTRKIVDRITEVAAAKHIPMCKVAKESGLVANTMYTLRSGRVLSEKKANTVSVRLETFAKSEVETKVVATKKKKATTAKKGQQDDVLATNKAKKRALSAHVKELSDASGKTMSDIAKMVGITPVTLVRLRADKLNMSAELLQDIENKLNIFERHLNADKKVVDAVVEEKNTPAEAVAEEFSEPATTSKIEQVTESVTEQDCASSVTVESTEDKPVRATVQNEALGNITLRGNAKAIMAALTKLLGEDNDKEIEATIFDFA